MERRFLVLLVDPGTARGEPDRGHRRREPVGGHQELRLVQVRVAGAHVRERVRRHKPDGGGAVHSSVLRPWSRTTTSSRGATLSTCFHGGACTTNLSSRQA